MTVAFALDFIPRRMKELGYGDEYITRWRHFQVEHGVILKLDASNEYYFLIYPPQGIVVRSKKGSFDVLDPLLNEMQYEHSGKIEVINTSGDNKMVLFIQVIPNHSHS